MYEIKETTTHWSAGAQNFPGEIVNMHAAERSVTLARGSSKEMMADLFLRLIRDVTIDQTLELFDADDWELLASYSPNGAFASA